MKTSMTKVSAALALMTLSGVAMAGIANTKHNLGGSTNAGNGGAGWNFNNSTTEICVFCHTPHGADSSATAPLWNRNLGTNTYNTYADLGTTTLDAAAAVTGSVSLACLSCHDGTQAMDSMANVPGAGAAPAGSFTSIGAGTGTGPNGWVEFQSMGSVSGEIINLGTDLRNDHPISIQYAGALTGTRVAIDTDFVGATSTTAGTKTVWYVDTGGAGKQKTDLPLYNRTDTTFTNEPMVECATCHDPHRENTTFLRHNSGNNGSATCLSCHTK